MSPRSDIIRAAVMASCLVVAGCKGPPAGSSPVQKPLARSVSEQSDTARLNVGDSPKQKEPDASANKPEVGKPLDLSMPPQPKIDLGSLEGKRPSTPQFLPDLFQREDKSDGRSLHLKGRVFVEQTGQENINSIEGGQIIMEMKTR